MILTENLKNKNLYTLDTGEEITASSIFSSLQEEYRFAFSDSSAPFLHFYRLKKKSIVTHSYTRGEFWEKAIAAANYLTDSGLKKGDRIVHAFSGNSIYDLVFRLACVLMGGVPVTINWQSDDNDSIVYKTKVTDAKLIIFDNNFFQRIDKIFNDISSVKLQNVEDKNIYKTAGDLPSPVIGYDDEKMIVFTSGTTGLPKGVVLTHRSYLANRLTFESYFDLSDTANLDLLLVNPLHHSNSSAISDWGTRRKGAEIHLAERYTTNFWRLLVDVSNKKRDKLIVPMVSRHFDFLTTLIEESKLPAGVPEIKKALFNIDILIGSAPVGPVTIERIKKTSNHLPLVRFGSTETCLQVTGTPIGFTEENLYQAFKAGWSHCYNKRNITGYYIGRPHPPFTRVRIVRDIDPEGKDYLVPCEIGEPGYIITQGPNIMKHYTGDSEASKNVFRDGWYTGLKDIVFALKSRIDGQLDYYWTSRESELLIRGGANYAYDQISQELKNHIIGFYNLNQADFHVAVVGLRIDSEHEDSCCVTIECMENSNEVMAMLEKDFIEIACKHVSKGAKPDYFRFASIPRNFKGAILYPELKNKFQEWLKSG